MNTKEQGLQILTQELQAELQLIGYPPSSWIPPSKELDVAIIGGGMAGLCASFALFTKGVTNQCIYDLAPTGFEGPWATYAKMLTLRSGKELQGPALNISKLTFQSWYRAQYGLKAWQALYKIPTSQWMDYLRWYRQVLHLPVENNKSIESLAPAYPGIHLLCKDGTHILAKKVVLATGRKGCGGPNIPALMTQTPKKYYAHTSEDIDYKSLKDKHICILGAGASAFDAVATALESGCASATLLMSKQTIPTINKNASSVYIGFAEGYYLLPDELKIGFMQTAKEAGTPPPFESLDRVKDNPHFKVLTNFKIQRLACVQNQLKIYANNRNILCDFLILGTGFFVDPAQDPLLKSFAKDIKKWMDCYPDLPLSVQKIPYIGRHYQFLEKIEGQAPYLKDIYCFNHAASLSQGVTSSDIPLISVGAARLATGISADLFVEQAAHHFEQYQSYCVKELDPAKYNFFTEED